MHPVHHHKFGHGWGHHGWGHHGWGYGAWIFPVLMLMFGFFFFGFLFKSGLIFPLILIGVGLWFWRGRHWAGGRPPFGPFGPMQQGHGGWGADDDAPAGHDKPKRGGDEGYI